MDFKVHSSIDIIFGPMFSGKSTELLRRLVIFGEAKFKVLYVNSSQDTRKKISHNKVVNFDEKDLPITYIKTRKLSDIIDMATKYDVIGIDEAQFFEDLVEFSTTLAEKFNKKIIVSGLNSDYKREKFGNIIDLIPICDDITKLFPFCVKCSEHNIFSRALFSKRIINIDYQTWVGASETYMPVCRACYK